MPDNGRGAGLVRLGDTDFTLEDPSQDIRSRDVYDREANQIGTVHDPYVDQREEGVRLLTVASGGLLGSSIGRTCRMMVA